MIFLCVDVIPSAQNQVFTSLPELVFLFWPWLCTRIIYEGYGLGTKGKWKSTGHGFGVLRL